MNVIAIHLDKSVYHKISLSTIKEISFDIIIFDEEFIESNPIPELKSKLSGSKLVAILNGSGEEASKEWEFDSTIRRDLKDVMTIYKSSECSAIEGVIHYLLHSLCKPEFDGKDLK